MAVPVRPNDESSADTALGVGEAESAPPLDRGTSVGRYTVLELLGRGGMGAVYKAYDPELDRSIALKVIALKPSSHDSDMQSLGRVMREAQALAQLSHPNVVAVHDVGKYAGSVYIAMELVEGQTVRDWLQAGRPSRREVLEVFRQAGEGLLAAHQAGLVHRDFKPANVILGRDGRVRVADFGLVRSLSAPEPEPNEPAHPALPHPGTTAGSDDSSGAIGLRASARARKPDQNAQKPDPNDRIPLESGKYLSASLTMSRKLLGTPQYMSPEQYLGTATDERTDQYSFCVSLFEALYGENLFQGRTLEELMQNVLAGRRTEPPATAGVPAWLKAILEKGLALEPAERHPSMREVLDALAADPEEAERRAREARRRSIRHVVLGALLATGLVLLASVFLREHQELCRGAEGLVAPLWNEEVKAKVRAGFLATDKSYAGDTYQRVDRILQGWTERWMEMHREACEATHVRGEQSGQVLDLRMECLRRELNNMKALVGLFSEKPDESVLRNAVEASLGLGDLRSCADEEALRSPYPPPKTLEAKAAVEIIREKLSTVNALSDTGKYEQGLNLARVLASEAEAAGWLPIQADVLYHMGKLLYMTGEYKAAETTLFDAAHAAGKSRDGRLVANAMSFLVFVVGVAQGRPQDGLLIGRNAEIDLELSGGDDDIRSGLLHNLGTVYYSQGEYDLALKHFRDSLAIEEKARGPEHLFLAMTINNIGATASKQGEYQKGLEYHQKALAIRENALGAEHPDVAQSLHNIGENLTGLGEYNAALESVQRAIAIREKTLRSDHPLLASSMYSLGSLLMIQGQTPQALEQLRKALAIQEKALHPEHPDVANTLNQMGGVFLAMGKPTEARALLERALGIYRKIDQGTALHGLAAFHLARALVATGGDKKRAIDLAKQARELLRKTPRVLKKEQDELEVWLDDHGVRQASVR